MSKGESSKNIKNWLERCVFFPLTNRVFLGWLHVHGDAVLVNSCWKCWISWDFIGFKPSGKHTKTKLNDPPSLSSVNQLFL